MSQSIFLTFQWECQKAIFPRIPKPDVLSDDHSINQKKLFDLMIESYSRVFHLLLFFLSFEDEGFSIFDLLSLSLLLFSSFFIGFLTAEMIEYFFIPWSEEDDRVSISLTSNDLFLFINLTPLLNSLQYNLFYGSHHRPNKKGSFL